MHAYAFRSGELLIGRKVEPGAIKIATAPAAILRQAVAGSARLGYDGQWLVPGVPEADGGDAALDALVAYQDRLAARLRKIAEPNTGS